MTSSTLERPESGPLAEMVNPTLYQRNLFRVLGIPANAGVREVRRRQKRLDIVRKLGTGSTEVNGNGLLALPMTDQDTIQVALDRLNDPKARFIDELFWFWPMDIDSANDPALAALEQGKLSTAIRSWSALDGSLQQRAVAVHNRAILNHLVALEYGQEALSRQQDGVALLPTEPVARQTEQLWQQVFADWQKTIDDDAFWDAAKSRVAEYDDEQLTSGFVHRLRSALPESILRSSAALALRFAEAGDAVTAKQLLAQMQSAWQSNDEVVNARRIVLAPLREQLESLSSAAREKSKTDEISAARLAEEMLDQAEPLLALVDTLLPAADPVRRAIHDDIAETINLCQVAYGNETEDWEKTLQLIDRALLVVAGEHQRKRIEGNREIVKENYEANLCFFCGEEKTDTASYLDVAMHGDVSRRRDGYVEWRKMLVTVPRCRRCKRWHAAEMWIALMCAVLVVTFLLALIWVFWPFLSSIDLHRYVEIFLVIVFLGSLIFYQYVLFGIFMSIVISGLKLKEIIMSITGIREEDIKETYPQIETLLRDGWELGERPDGVTD